MKACEYLTQEHKHSNKTSLCMIRFILKNILSYHKSVTRGICEEENQKLVQIVETSNIEKIDGKSCCRRERNRLRFSSIYEYVGELYLEFIDLLLIEFLDFFRKHT